MVPARSKRLLSLAGDERLVEQIRCGSDVAFEVAYERYGAGILGFCRHMLGSHEEAEDAVQHTFAAAHSDLLRNQRPVKLKPWLYTIARNRCLSMLRARREHPGEPPELSTVGLHEQVQQRADLQDLLRDLGDLPEEQRAALLLAEVGDLSHTEVAQALGCEVQRVKALVFRARTGLMQRREAREAPCGEIREQLANLRGGALRRSELRHHLRACAGCRAFGEQVTAQRRMLGLALPVTPSLGLKAGVLGAAGIGGGSAGGGAAAGGLAAAGGSVASGTLAKVAVLTVMAGGGAAATEAVIEREPTPGAPEVQAGSAGDEVPGRARGASPPGSAARRGQGRRDGRRGERARRRGRGPGLERSPGPPADPGTRGLGPARRAPSVPGGPRGGSPGGPAVPGAPSASRPSPPAAPPAPPASRPTEQPTPSLRGGPQRR